MFIATRVVNTDPAPSERHVYINRNLSPTDDQELILAENR